ncbi:protein ZGRF1-like isoform X4 [Acanthaster planci]|uniref:Protein ZGRF1-like isoform X4 n=1 Tax=Acanthaster planci TaxID=133434 RepID=A0A8B7ZC01_ACAPL|nr:protein ZGRF1-like isoform X4 [Acanthaster planci]
MNKDAPINLRADFEGLPQTEASRFMPRRCEFVETLALFHKTFDPTCDDPLSGTGDIKPADGAVDNPFTSHTRRRKGFLNPVIKVTGQTALSSGRSRCGELFFPSFDEVQGGVSLQRQVQIPASFSSVAHYKQVFTSAIKEHLNIILFELSQRYHSAKDKADVHYLDSSLQQSDEQSGDTTSPRCDHGNPAKMVCVKKDGANKGRFFYACSAQRANQCKFFMWADKFKGNSSNANSTSVGSSRTSLTTSTAATMYFKSHKVHLYYGCELQRRASYNNLMPGAPAWIRKHKQQMLENTKKKLYLRLSRKELSSMYGKEDIWVISKDLAFDSRSTFLARSVYHGPSSNSDVEIEPLAGYSTSNWASSCTVHALLACNASSEMTCLNNIQEFVNAGTVPILPYLLGSRSDEVFSNTQSRISTFRPPAQGFRTSRNLNCSSQEIEQITAGMIEKYELNTDQAEALRKVTAMFQQASNDKASPKPITLIHGVFGAGKSFLLAVTVLLLIQLFELNDAHYPGNSALQLPWKLLIASTTNVAVDRILSGLLDLGFEDFIRVGSVKKIAKPVLPYSVHASDSKDSQEIRELYEMLKTDLTPTEKHQVKRSIERQRLGRNRDLLGSVKVVGVTCAASTFPCMNNLKFPVVLLDECSQMTEPSSLLPITRFQCENLVLVGDPKQLDPTIQGSEATHGCGLEQTLFDRLILLGCKPILLRTQYRCHPTISAIANSLFYEQQLIDGVTTRDRLPLAPLPTLCFYSVSSGKECGANDGSYYNEQEASFVVFLIETLVLLGVQSADIGVITLYKAQTAQINILLQASKLSIRKSLKAIQISTVDAFQGGEKGVIILSCVRTDYMGFADSDKRTNVALTRSKNHLLIVGNLRILSANTLWGKVIDKCKDVENGIQSSQLFRKQWTPQLEELLKQDPSHDQTEVEGSPHPQNSPYFSPASEMEDSTAKEVGLHSSHKSSPSPFCL